jgi:hypothetical protein
MSRARLVLLVCLGAALACNSDDTGAFVEASSTSTGEPGSSSSSTGAPTTTTGEGSSSTGEPGTTTTGATTELPPEQTCRDALTCFQGCAVSLDPACFQGCAEGLPPEEGMKALGLGACVVQGCFEAGGCSLETLQDPLCLACIGFGLLSDNPKGCEEQAEACK